VFRPILVFLTPQPPGGLHHAAELFGGDALFIDAAVGKAAETAVGIEENLLRFPELQGFLSASDDGFRGLGFVGSGIDATEADLGPDSARPTTASSPARGVQYSRTSWRTCMAWKQFTSG